MKYPYKTKHNKQEAKEITAHLTNIFKNIPGVIGISFGGGIGREFFDDYSDVDVFVWVKDEATKKKVEKLYPKEDYSIKGYELDWRPMDYQEGLKQKVPSDFWNDQARLDFKLSLITHDPQNLIEKLRKRVVFMSEKEKEERMKKEFDFMRWFINYTLDAWLKRDSLPHALQAYFSALDHLLYWLYVKNGKFIPWPDKWKFLWLETGEIPESKYYQEIAELYLVRELSANKLKVDFPPETADKGKKYWKNVPELKQRKA